MPDKAVEFDRAQVEAVLREEGSIAGTARQLDVDRRKLADYINADPALKALRRTPSRSGTDDDGDVVREFRAGLPLDKRRELEEFERRCGRLGDREKRVIPLGDVEVRDSGNPSVEFTVQGHAAVFGRKSLDLGYFQEVIDRGAFDKVLDANPDVHLLWDHDTRLALARTRSSQYTLELRDDPKGLRFYSKVAPTSFAADLRILMEGGIIDQASFAFTVASDTWEIRNEGGKDEVVIRTIHEVAELFDVTITAQGAYPQTDSTVVRDYAKAYAQVAESEEREALDPEQDKTSGREEAPEDVATDAPEGDSADTEAAPDEPADPEQEASAPDAPDEGDDSAAGTEDEPTVSPRVRKVRARMAAVIARHRADMM